MTAPTLQLARRAGVLEISFNVRSKAWFSLGHKHKHKDRRRRRKPEFSIPAPLDVKQDGGRHG